MLLPRPKLHDYKTLEAYIEELIDWKFECYWLRDMGIDPESGEPDDK